MTLGRLTWTAALVLSACVTGSEDFNRFALDRAMQKWRDNGPDSYAFTFTQSCMCEGPGTPVRIVVRDLVVESRTVVDTGEPLDPRYASRFPAIPGIFGIVVDAMSGTAYSLVVEYDATYGFPVRIELDFTPSTVSDNARYSVADFSPLN